MKEELGYFRTQPGSPPLSVFQDFDFPGVTKGAMDNFTGLFEL
jgi:hypothetical protein